MIREIKKPLKIAFYGKGGIGKSTIASNVAAAFSVLGFRVLFIGCDPKGDSTRNIMGKKIKPIINLLQEKEGELESGDFMKVGFNDIHCIETGGPEAGTGCAGRGIITMTEELENHQILQRDWDIIIYDVLGDVVCGGFAVPMREQYVDAVYIVTSSEFMSIYAANNIMKSIAKFSEEQAPFFGGLIYNQRSNNPDIDLVQAFAKKTVSEIIETIPYSEEIIFAELESKTTVEKYEASEQSEIFKSLAKKICEKGLLNIPSPLEEEALEIFSKEVLKNKVKARVAYA